MRPAEWANDQVAGGVVAVIMIAGQDSVKVNEFNGAFFDLTH
jgi:hypothetical protein